MRLIWILNMMKTMVFMAKKEGVDQHFYEKKDLEEHCWIQFIDPPLSKKRPLELNLTKSLELANFILILYNFHFISESAYVNKYRDFIEKYDLFLGTYQNFA